MKKKYEFQNALVGIRKNVCGMHTALVLGSGPSMRGSWLTVRRDLTIGVNAVSTELHVDILLLLDHPKAFRAKGNLDAILTGQHGDVVLMRPQAGNWHDLDILKPKRTWFINGHPTNAKEVPKYAGPDLEATGWVPVFNGASFAAIGFAVKLGFKRVVVGGVDYTKDHTWGNAEKLERVDRAYGHLVAWARDVHNCEVVNASPYSRLTMIPPMVK